VSLAVLLRTEFEVTLTELVTSVVVVGVKVSVITAVAPGARLMAPDPLIPKGAVGVATVPVSSAVPVFFTCRLAFEVVPIAVDGNTMVDGFSRICAPVGVGVIVGVGVRVGVGDRLGVGVRVGVGVGPLPVPVPCSLSVAIPLRTEFEVTSTVLVTSPDAVGVKVSVITAVAPGARLMAPDPLIPKGADGAATLPVSSAVPVFFTCRLAFEVVPTAVDANTMVDGFSRICAPVGVGVIVGVGVSVGVGDRLGVGDVDTLYRMVPVAGLPDATTS
jgi:hypothetical protein